MVSMHRDREGLCYTKSHIGVSAKLRPRLRLDITTLTKRWQYMGAMVEASKIGELIRSLDLSKPREDVGRDFIDRLQATNL